MTWACKQLFARESYILGARYGLDDGEPKSFREIAKELCISLQSMIHLTRHRLKRQGFPFPHKPAEYDTLDTHKKRGDMGKQKYTAETVAEAIKRAKGFVNTAARGLGCSRRTVYRYLDRYPSIREALIEAREAMLDISEIKLLEQIQAGNITAILFFLKTQGKDRGYTERHEVSGEAGPIAMKGYSVVNDKMGTLKKDSISGEFL